VAKVAKVAKVANGKVTGCWPTCLTKVANMANVTKVAKLISVFTTCLVAVGCAKNGFRRYGMTSYAELHRQRKLARPLYLELRALGLDVRVHKDPDAPSGYSLELVGSRSLSSGHADRLARRIEEAMPGVLKVLSSAWEEDLVAIRREGGLEV
jgi:hypothetical protein